MQADIIIIAIIIFIINIINIIDIINIISIIDIIDIINIIIFNVLKKINQSLRTMQHVLLFTPCEKIIHTQGWFQGVGWKSITPPPHE